ncbi:Uma2 family endonuclease [Acinetobacter haemolyticus]|uniref:Uma2 family endonuclease n=1 Tax=Acinetobacter haemolyticus TaxID=29430 RepID=UPI0013734EC3|nr:Uma2 family endonuclease [Acinetobacter haemolyticus]NAR28267.1 Uma2 family endonuclease [Acinetobacter haemolyticus]
MKTVNKHRLNEQEYLQGELSSQIKHEFVAGEVFAMVGASASHNLISGNIFAELRSHLKGKPCRPYINDMKVKIAENFYYPDVVVDCSDISNDAYFVETPILIVEVLSASTKNYDKTFKLQQYKNIPTLQEYIMIEQETQLVEVVSRLDGWQPHYYELGESFILQSVGLQMSVADVYDGLKL